MQVNALTRAGVYWLMRCLLTDTKTLSPLNQVVGAVFECPHTIRQLRAYVNPLCLELLGSIALQSIWEAVPIAGGSPPAQSAESINVVVVSLSICIPPEASSL